MIRVFIADDQLLVRQGIRTLLEMESSISIAGEAADCVETVSRVPQLAVDVLLLDIRMPKQNGIEVLQQLAGKNALPPTLVLTTFDDSAAVLDAIRAGARGFMLKDVSYEQLIAALRAIHDGGTVFQPAITERLLRAASHVHIDAPPLLGNLTDRERDVVRLMSRGYSNREIAYALHTAEGTIKNHVSSVLSKFGVRDRTSAVLKALESGLL